MRETISAVVENAIKQAIESGELSLGALPDTSIERPRDSSHGDWATTVALRIAKEAGKNPRDIATIIANHISESDTVASVEIAGPGFINLRLSPAALQSVLVDARTKRSDFARSNTGRGERVQVEFVSANPVGPMHVGHGRWAALGDAIATLLEYTGYNVEREFYINDAGVQMDVFATSVSARYLEICGQEVEFPENGYKGAYISDIAQEIYDDEGDVWACAPARERETHFKERAYKQVLAHLEDVLKRVGVTFDVWFSERQLHMPDQSGVTDIVRGIERLREAGYIYEKDGATWFRSTDFKDDKDRVIVKADGEYTYFAADIAYHANKFERGFDRVIDLWGADHHGYIARMKAACAALGYPDQLEIIIGQLVSLYRNGELVRMSKRTGEMVTFEELVDEVGADAARYFFLYRSTDQPLDFDITLAKEKSSENPIYYVQYAHARICSILRKAAGVESVDADITALADKLIARDTDLSPLTDTAELALMRKISEFSDVVELAARDRAPYRLTHYAEDLAATFHQFYTRCHVITDDKRLTNARLYAVDATRHALETVLSLIGVAAPTSM